MSFFEQIGRYQIKHSLGQGGMATVYLAEDPDMKRRVAVKVLAAVLTADREFSIRFKREAQVIANLEHPNIVPVYDVGFQGDQPYIVMRYMPGGTLEDQLKKRGPLSVADTADILEPVCVALDYVHDYNIIHRDIKPANILFDEHDKAYLGDFGIIKIAGDNANLTGGAVVGTAAYISPEQVYGDAPLDHRSDIYALGAVVFEMLTGQRPFTADSPTKLMMKHVLDPVPNICEINPDLPEAAATVVYIAMSKSPATRYDSAGALAKAIRQISQQIPSRRSRRSGIDDLLSHIEDEE